MSFGNAVLYEIFYQVIYNMMPFIASMIILAFTSKNSMAPKAEGIPYDKGSR